MSTEASLRAEIKTFLRAERSGHSLSEVLVETLVTYLVDVEKFTRADQVTPAGVHACANEAWAAVHGGSSLPLLQKHSLSLWYANVPESADGSPSPPVGPEGQTGGQEISDRAYRL